MNESTMIGRRGFTQMLGLAAGSAWLAGCTTWRGANGPGAYSVAVLGDTHFDAEPESVYHSHYDESNKWAKVQHEEFRRNGEMWRSRCRELLSASARLALENDTRFVLQLGDIIQGDCDDVPTHKKMLDDCIRMLRAPYPDGIPFLTVVGNHDFRGKGAWDAYFQFAEPFMSSEIERLKAERLKVASVQPPAVQPSTAAKYPAFSFRVGMDLWVFCNFETDRLDAISNLIDADPDARHVFLVTHGPFTTFGDGGSYRWRLGGWRNCEAARPRLYETLSRRRAIVLSGHTHSTNFYRHENRFGGFSEFTVNSVWAKPELATAEPMHEGAKDYGTLGLASVPAEKRDDYRREMDFFKPGVKEYFFNRGAGHYRLDVSDASVTMAFHPGAALEPACTFRLA